MSLSCVGVIIYLVLDRVANEEYESCETCPCTQNGPRTIDTLQPNIKIPFGITIELDTCTPAFQNDLSSSGLVMYSPTKKVANTPDIANHTSTPQHPSCFMMELATIMISTECYQVMTNTILQCLQ